MISLLQGGLLLLFSQTNSIYLMYFCYIFYRSWCQIILVVSQWNIAKKMVTDSYGLAFGFDYFIALGMQSVLTGIVNDKRGLGMQVREAFLVYAGLHGVISFVFFTFTIYSIISNYIKKDKVVTIHLS